MSNNEKSNTKSAQDRVWPEFLDSAHAIAEHVSNLSPYEISKEQIEEQYFGCRARLTWFDLSSLILRSDDHNLPSKSRQKQIDSLAVETMPPLLVENSFLEDGYHRHRKLAMDGMSNHWAYVIEEAPEDVPEPPNRLPSKWDSAFDITP